MKEGGIIKSWCKNEWVEDLAKVDVNFRFQGL